MIRKTLRVKSSGPERKEYPMTTGEWNTDMSSCPKGVRLTLRNKNGNIIVGYYNGEYDDHMIAWKR